MIVYGDHKRMEDARHLRTRVSDVAESLGDLASGITRHAELVGLFIAVSELVQAMADREFQSTGLDADSPPRQQGARLLLGLASEVVSSWQSGFATSGPLDLGLRRMLAELDCQGAVSTGAAEGYAHYALYPESYLVAARDSGLGPNTCVIGIRSIGLGLAAIVAAAIGTPAPLSVRPVGHPFQRQIRADPDVIAPWRHDPSASFAIVDEGPGLSGSSVNAVVRWLREIGIAIEQIHLFPSHSGEPGREASREIRRTWSYCRKHVAASFERTFAIGPHMPALRDWVAEAVGNSEVIVTDISGGTWRDLHYANEAEWPASWRAREAQKFLAVAGEARWLVKFAGLGATGQRKSSTAVMLHKAGFGPEVVGLCHGFLIERWIDGTTLDGAPISNRDLVVELGRYLAWRAIHLHTSEEGASLSALADMATHNAAEALGSVRAAELREWFSQQTPPKHARRVEIDGRLHPWEFIVCADRKLVKTDAVDHCVAHDLIGCQPVEWDVAAARFEHALSASESDTLAGYIEEQLRKAFQRSIDVELIDYLQPCYLAFQLGFWSLAAQSEHGGEKARTQKAVKRYQEGLVRFLDDLRRRSRA
ncbi:MAG: hypothetical protein EOS78_02570 [Mesorhizobium sp.]|nr:MAG: hypothetical protein EOS78_02570 [Mesorhizobium sp.]